MKDTAANPYITFPVFKSADMTVVCGANHGDQISFSDELNPGDIYKLHPNARQHILSLSENESGSFEITYGTNLGHIDATVYLDSCLTMMTANGTTVEVLILVEVDHLGHVEMIYTVPLDVMNPGTEYTLIDISRKTLPAKFTSVAIINETIMDYAVI